MKKHFIPITKVDEEKRLVYLRAASETVDYAGESMDYEKTKPNFQKWSDEAYERSAGKSYGNIREMHSSIAAGKLNEPLIFDDDAKTVDIVVYVSDDNSWQKVKDGVLTGASIGGSYEDIKFDPTLGVKRYVADLTEISLVDSPCNPDAVIEVIKANGVVELKKGGIRPMTSLEKLTKGLEKNLQGELKKSFSFSEIQDRVKNSIKSRIQDNSKQLQGQGGYAYGYNSYYDYGYFYVVACYDDSIVIEGCFGDNRASYNIQVDYTIDDEGVVTLGDARIVSMQPVEVKDNDGNNEALKLFEGDEPAEMNKGKEPLAGSKINKNYTGGINVMDIKDLSKAMENPELLKAIQTVVSLTGTDEEKAALEKAMGDKAPAKKEEDMTAAKKAKTEKDPDKDGDDDSTAAGDTDQDAGAGKKKAKKAVEIPEEATPMEKAYTAGMNALTKANEMLMARIKDLEAQPVAGGPAVNAGNVEKSIGGQVQTQDPLDGQIAMLKDIAAGTVDMGAREAIQKQLANLEMQKAKRSPIVFKA